MNDYDEKGNLVRFRPQPHFEWLPFRRSYWSIVLYSEEMQTLLKQYVALFVHPAQREEVKQK